MASPEADRKVSRRTFMLASGSVAGSLVVALRLPAGAARSADASVEPWVANAFVRIAPNDRITVLLNQVEMGQGVYTALPMLVAEELDADWNHISIEVAPVTPEYHHAVYGTRMTVGSMSIKAGWEQLRTAGAMARTLLVQAASERWKLDPTSLRTERSHVIHRESGRHTNYGSLVGNASRLPKPLRVQLKNPADFKIIGTDVKRLEGPDQVTGKAVFSIDVRLPGMLTAVVAHSPVFGERVKSYAAGEAMTMTGVIKVKQISTGVAVIAKDFWTAKTARDKLQIEWEGDPAARLSTTVLEKQYRGLLDQPGVVVETIGDADDAMKKAVRSLDAIYEVPYLAHAPMEPLNCVAKTSRDRCELWVGTQDQSSDIKHTARVLGIPPENVTVNSTLMGGGFGRRAVHVSSDYIVEAAEVARGESVPIKTIWTREQDIQGGYYRPMFVERVVAGLDAEGMPAAWLHRLAGPPTYEKVKIDVNSVLSTAGGHGKVSPLLDPNYARLLNEFYVPYAIPNQRIEVHSRSNAMTVTSFRSIGSSHNTFVRESFLDEVAHAGGNDPAALRRKLLEGHPRHLRVLDLAMEKAAWGGPRQKGRAQGIAIQKFAGTYVVQIADVSVLNHEIKVHRVVCAVDCGIAVNPTTVRAQLEGGIIFGLTAALYGQITVEDGRIQQSNFHDYPMLRMNAAPQIDVHIVKSSESPTGVGEVGVPPVAPAVTNAIFSLTGKRIRKLPIRI